MFTSRVVLSLVVATGICAVVGAGPGARVQGQQSQPPEQPPPPAQQQPPPAQQPAAQPTFRADANFVLTDVFVTKDGKPVTDLTIADFEVREDGAVQTIRSFEAVRHDLRPAVGMPRRNPTTVAESEAMAADPRRRVFVVFLDTFHVERADAMWVRKMLLGFFKDSVGPDDLIAYMTPHMSGADISFSTSTDPILAYLDANPVWGVADESPGTETDPVERDLQTCFPPKMDEDWLRLRSRLREQKSIMALEGLVAYLDGIRENRKAIIAVTGGWRLFSENPTRLTDRETAGRIMGTDPIGVGPDGRLGMPDRNRINGVTDSQCDGARMLASQANTDQTFRNLIAEANRSSTSFYTVDVRGLRTETRPMPTTPTGAMIEARNRERRPYSTTLDSIRELASATNGLAVVDTNDIEGGMRRAAADLNAYYLLGYTSTNSQPDGRYRKIKVAVKRPGVEVRARDGYLARRPNERPSESPSTSAGRANTVNPEAALITAALGKLTPSRPGVPLVLAATAGAVKGGPSRVIRVVAELDSAVAATPEWAEGGEAHAFVRDIKGATLTEAKAPLAKGSRTVELELPVVDGMSGDVKVQIRLQGTGALARYTDTTVVALDALPAGWGAPRLSRRGPSTGIAWVPTADPRFRRQERVRVTVGAPAADAGPVTGALLDRQGKPMNVPVKVEQSEPTALVAELALAPLAAGDYVLALGGGPRRLLVPLRVVP